MPRIDADKVLWKEVDGLVVVLLVSVGHFVELNKIGSIIWKMLAEGQNQAAIVDTLSRTYDAPKEKLTADVNDFIEQMITKGLVQLS